MKKSTTRRALILGVLSLVMCVCMLVGTTYAWFTDTVASSDSKIKSGTLDIELWMADGTGSYGNISDSSDPIFGMTSNIAQNVNSDTLWEPGKTQVAYLYIKNAGNLALKYTVSLDVVSADNLHEAMSYQIVPDAEYGDVIDWTGTGSRVAAGTQTVASDVSLAVGACHYFALVVHMDEEAGNEYQDKQITFDMNVFAAQDTVEYDAFDDQYDKDAIYDTAVTGAAELVAALEQGGKIEIGSDIDVAGATFVRLPATINLGASTVSSANGDPTRASNYSTLTFVADSTISGGTVENTAGYGVTVGSGATLTIVDGSYVGIDHAVYVHEGTLKIEGGFFACTGYTGANEYVLNILDRNRATSSIVVTGGTFVNFNPADNGAEGAHTNFVAAGYTVEAETQANGDVWYTVVSE